MERSERLDIAHWADGDIVVWWWQCKLGKHRDAESGGDERAGDCDVVHLVGDVGPRTES
jgi:hypothetical protein